MLITLCFVSPVCEAGKYAKNESAATACVNCPLHSFSPERSSNITFCNCNQGYTGPDGTACVSCDPTNTFKPTRGSAPCGNCTKDVCETGFFRPMCNITTDGLCQRCSNAPDFAIYTSHGAPYGKENCNWTCDTAGGYIPSARNGTFCSVRGRARVCFTHETTCEKCSTNCSQGFYAKDCRCQPCSTVVSWPPVNAQYADVEGVAACGWQCKSTLSNARCAEPGNGLCRLPCPSGAYGDANEGCKACPAGTSSAVSSLGNFSDVGNFSEVANSSLFGNFSDVANSNATLVHDCVLCTPGKFKPALGVMQCENREIATLEPCALEGTCGDKCPSACVALDEELAVCCRAFVDVTKSTCQELSCVPCPSGSYSDTAGAARCEQCPLYAISSPGSRNRTECKCAPGFEGRDGGSCRRCVAGKYKASAGTAGGDCLACEAGKYAPDDAATVCLQCSSGTISVAGSVMCTDNSVNVEVVLTLAMNASSFVNVQAQYVEEIAGVAGVPSSSVSLSVNSSSSSRRLLSSGVTVFCEITSPRFHVATLIVSLKTVLVSRLGEIGPLPTLDTLREACGSGREQIGAACHLCATGKYKNMADNSTCVPCPSGTTTRAKGTIQESDCACTAGYFTNASTGECDPCPAGTFKTFGPGDCSPCANGTWSAGTTSQRPSDSCTFCPVDSYRSQRGSVSEDDCCGERCACDAGYHELGDLQCVPCERGYYKPVSGTSTCIMCGKGRFTNATAAATSCSECPLDTYNAQAGATVCTDCPPSTSTVQIGGSSILACKCRFSAAHACRGCPADQYGLGPSDREVKTLMPRGWSHGDVVATAPDGTQTSTGQFQPNDIDMRYPLPGNIAVVTNFGKGQVLYINVSTGDITPVTWGGHGFAIGDVSEAKFYYPGAAAASPDGSMILVAGANAHRVMRIDLSHGNVSVFAGPPSELGAGTGLDGTRDGNTSFARFKYPDDVLFHPDGNRVFVSSFHEGAIRLIDIAADQVITIYSGGAINAVKMAITEDGNTLVFTGYGTQNIGAMDLTVPGSYPVRIVAGKDLGYADGVGTSAKFKGPWDITVTPDGATAFVIEWSSYAIRSVDMKTGAVSTLAGSGTEEGYLDGYGLAARFKGVRGLTLTPDGSMLLVAEAGNNRFSVSLLSIFPGRSASHTTPKPAVSVTRVLQRSCLFSPRSLLCCQSLF